MLTSPTSTGARENRSIFLKNSTKGSKKTLYKSAANLSLAVQILLYVNIAASAIHILANIFSQACLFAYEPNVRFSSDECNSLWWLQFLGALPGQLIFYPTGLVFIVWLLRIRNNALALNIEELRSKGYECWLCFIMPHSFFYLPARIIQELWKASTSENLDALDWKKTSESTTIKLWWTFWIYMIMSEIIQRAWLGNLNSRDEPVAKYFWIFLFSSICELLAVGAALCAILFVRDMTNRQGARHELLELQSK